MWSYGGLGVLRCEEGSHGLITMTEMIFKNILWMDAYKILAAYLPQKALRRKWTATSHFLIINSNSSFKWFII